MRIPDDDEFQRQISPRRRLARSPGSRRSLSRYPMAPMIAHPPPPPRPCRRHALPPVSHRGRIRLPWGEPRRGASAHSGAAASRCRRRGTPPAAPAARSAAVRRRSAATVISSRMAAAEIGDAGLALHGLGLAAVTVRGRHQGDARADGRVVMHEDIHRHAQEGGGQREQIVGDGQAGDAARHDRVVRAAAAEPAPAAGPGCGSAGWGKSPAQISPLPSAGSTRQRPSVAGRRMMGRNPCAISAPARAWTCRSTPPPSSWVIRMTAPPSARAALRPCQRARSSRRRAIARGSAATCCAMRSW